MSLLINCTSYEQAWERIAKCHASGRSVHGPKHLRLLGPTGTGKTFLLDQYFAAHPRIDKGDRALIPVLLVPVPAAPTPKGLYRAILHAMSVQCIGSCDLEDLQHRVVTLIRNLGVQMLIFDEINHIVDRGRRRTHEAVTDRLKQLVDAIKIPVVFAGALRAAQLFEANAQLRSRVTATCTLTPFDLDTKFDELRGFIQCWLEETHPAAQCKWMASTDIATRIFYATDGVQRQLADFLGAVPVWAGKGALSPEQRMDDLAQLFRDQLWETAPTKKNPFSASFVFRRLNQPGEPYCPTVLDGDNHREPASVH